MTATCTASVVPGLHAPRFGNMFRGSGGTDVAFYSSNNTSAPDTSSRSAAKPTSIDQQREALIQFLSTDRVENLSYISRFSALSIDTILDPKVRSAACGAITRSLLEDSGLSRRVARFLRREKDPAIFLRDFFIIPDEDFHRSVLCAAARSCFVGRIREAKSMLARYLPAKQAGEGPSRAELQAQKEVVFACLLVGRVARAERLRRIFAMAGPAFRGIVREAYVTLEAESKETGDANSQKAQDLKKQFPISPDGCRVESEALIFDCLKTGQVAKAEGIAVKFNIAEQRLRDLKDLAIEEALKKSSLNLAYNLAVAPPASRTYNADDTASFLALPTTIREFLKIKGVSSLTEAAELEMQETEAFNFLKTAGSRACRLTADYQDMAVAHNLSALEMLELWDARYLPFEIRDSQGAVSALQQCSAEWMIPEVRESFRAAALVFGADRVFHFMNRSGLSRRDALRAIPKFCHYCFRYGLDADEMYENLLGPVAADNHNYSSGSAHDLFADFLSELPEDLESAIYTVNHHLSYGRLGEPQCVVQRVGDIFASWDNFRLFSDLWRQTKGLEPLVEIDSAPPKYRSYAYALLARGDLGFNLNFLANLLCGRAEIALGRGDSHTRVRVEDRKKATQLFGGLYNDLAPKDAVGFLLGGTANQYQLFTPLCIRYRVPEYAYLDPEAEHDLSIRACFRRALDRNRAGKDYGARRRGDLYHAAQELCSQMEFSLDDYLKKGATPPDGLEDKLQELLVNPEFGVCRANTVIIEARIYAKNDPEAAIRQQESRTCDTHDSGKVIHNWLNPACANFAMVIRTEDPKGRLLSQSTLTFDRELGTSTPVVIAKNAMRTGPPWMLPESVVQPCSFTPGIESAEAPKGYRGTEWARLARIIYADFLRRYADTYGEEQNLTADRVIVGKGSLTIARETQANTTMCLVPPMFLNKDANVAGLITLGLVGNAITVEPVSVPELGPAQRISQPRCGVSPLFFYEALPVSRIEWDMFQGQPDLIQGTPGQHITLLSATINQALKNRPNLSVKYVDRNGRISGYFEAREGSFTPAARTRSAGKELKYHPDNTSETALQEGQRIIYVSDVAAYKHAPQAFGKMLIQFLRTYKAEYLDKNNPIPIVFNIRAGSPYTLIAEHLQTIQKILGHQVELRVERTFPIGQEKPGRMYFCVCLTK